MAPEALLSHPEAYSEDSTFSRVPGNSRYSGFGCSCCPEDGSTVFAGGVGFVFCSISPARVDTAVVRGLRGAGRWF